MKGMTKVGGSNWQNKWIITIYIEHVGDNNTIIIYNSNSFN